LRVNPSPTSGAVLHVLYVEDEECDRMFMEAAFRKAGMGEALRAVVDGREAMEYLGGNGAYADRSRHPMPALVLLDLNLPMVSGFDVLKWMRGRPEIAALPVMIFSSSSKEEDRVKARELGASEFVEKPSSAMRFGDVVEELRRKWLQRAERSGCHAADQRA
jgi:CheY-like chemotaxis protein